MNQNTLKILHFLIEEQPKTASTLASQLKVSVRSVKSYIKVINSEYKDVIHSSYLGYTINTDAALNILKEYESTSVPQTSKERVIFIINKLINHNNHHELNLYDLADELYISLSTLKKELVKAKRKMGQFDLELNMKGDYISAYGTERNKRKLLSTFLYEESNINFMNIDSLQKVFTQINVLFINETLINVFKKRHYFVNDYSLVNLVLHITITIDRILNHNTNLLDIENLPLIYEHEYALAAEVASNLERHFNINYNDSEIYELALLIASRASSIDYNSVTSTNLSRFIGKDCMSLVAQLIKDINNNYSIDLRENEFMIRFALHIKNLLVRAKNDYFSKNPLTDSIKTSCPLIYDIAVTLAGTIQEKTNIFINDDEIAYIAFHLGNALEVQKDLTTKVPAILYYPSYYDMNEKIAEKINHRFLDELIITNIVTTESELMAEKGNNLIISTIPLSKNYQNPVVYISVFFNEKDKNLLSEKICEIKKTTYKAEFESYIRELVSSDLFEKTNALRDSSKAIHYMANRLIELDYVNERFEEEILDREKLSSTAFGRFAIPHAIKMDAKKTGILVIISETPIVWDIQNVHLVLMMCFNKDERYIFNEIYEPLTVVLNNNENIKKLISAENYETFIKCLVSLV